jgi:adenylyltransferase/sulfurtransferase
MEDSIAASESARGPSCTVNLIPRSLPGTYEISCVDYHRIRKQGETHILLDVRVPEQYDLCALPGAVNIPANELQEKLDDIAKLSEGTKPVYCMCRRGIASAAATDIIREALHQHPAIHSVRNIKGGLDAWRAQVDESFPRY